jgi:hypothetical protein
MSSHREPEVVFRELCAAARGRRHQRQGWTSAAVAAAFVFALLAWEIVIGPAGVLRWLGYLAVTIVALVAGWRFVHGWRGSAIESADIVAELGRLFPQTRGTLEALLDDPRTGLAAARRRSAAAWLGRRGSSGLDRALAYADRSGIARRRWLALGMVAFAALTAISQPTAASRLAGALQRPQQVWRSPTVEWTVVPGDVDVAYGSPLAGQATIVGPPARGPLLLESRPPASAWRAETLALGPTGSWQWSEITSPFEYRVTFGPFTSPAYRVTVRVPVAIVRVEARFEGEAWAPLAGRTVSAGETLEIRGAASHPIDAAWVQWADGRKTPLEIEDVTFAGRVQLAAGEAWVVARTLSGDETSPTPFTVIGAGYAFVQLLQPDDDPTVLGSAGVWLEVRAGAAAGLQGLRWETDDGRGGAIGAVGGTRDTSVMAIARLGAERAPGDSFRFRVVARPLRGGSAATEWRTAVMASRAALSADVAADRAVAGREIDRALEAAQREVRGEGSAGDQGDLDARLRAAADSLAQTLDRTLADPGLHPGLAERLAAYRRLLEGTSQTDLTPQLGLPNEPDAELSARALMLEAIREGLAETEALIQLSMTADTLAGLARSEDELASDTRGADPDRLSAEIEPRQAEIDAAASAAAETLPDSLRTSVEAALENVDAQMAERDPAALASAQKQAAEALEWAADGARAEVDRAAGAAAARRIAIDRAGAEVLFLARRQRELAVTMVGPPSGPGQHAARVARQAVVGRGLETALGALVEAIGGRPAGVELAARLAQAVFSVRYAGEAVAAPPGEGIGNAQVQAATEDAATALMLLARAFLLPESEGAAGGAEGAAGSSGQIARQLESMAQAERSLANALGSSDEPVGGNPEAAAAQREVGRQLDEIAAELLEMGIDVRTVQGLETAVEELARQLERGIPGARADTDLRALARRLADVGRMVERETTDHRRAETARDFVPEMPPPLPSRASAQRLDPETALAPWRSVLPRGVLDSVRAYLESLAEAGVRSTSGSE